MRRVRARGASGAPGLLPYRAAGAKCRHEEAAGELLQKVPAVQPSIGPACRQHQSSKRESRLGMFLALQKVCSTCAYSLTSYFLHVWKPVIR